MITCLKFPNRITFVLFSVRGIGLNYSYLVVESHWSNSFTCFLAFIPSFNIFNLQSIPYRLNANHILSNFEHKRKLNRICLYLLHPFITNMFSYHKRIILVPALAEQLYRNFGKSTANGGRCICIRIQMQMHWDWGCYSDESINEHVYKIPNAFPHDHEARQQQNLRLLRILVSPEHQPQTLAWHCSLAVT